MKNKLSTREINILKKAGWVIAMNTERVFHAYNAPNNQPGFFEIHNHKEAREEIQLGQKLDDAISGINKICFGVKKETPQKIAYFIDCDDEAWYIIPFDQKKQWKAWVKRSCAGDLSGGVPKFAKKIKRTDSVKFYLE